MTNDEKTPLKHYRILLADADTELARVLKSMLKDLGFSNCEIVHQGSEAYKLLKNEPFDFLITEWKTGAMSGLDLLRRIRQAPDSPNPILPIIMLSGRAEVPDVIKARDNGINEFVVKPFSARSIFDRIQRIIEQPREFVISPDFVGPSRRTKSAPPPGKKERRAPRNPELQPKDVHGALQTKYLPKIWLPDFSLKYKLGTNIKLEHLITEAVLAQAQAAVEAISDSSVVWVRNDLRELNLLITSMVRGEASSTVSSHLAEQTLTINARTGTVGYSCASEVAYLLYLFCTHHLNYRNPDHHRVVEKHAEVLHVILGNQMRGSAGAIGAQMVSELKKLAGKFSS